MGNSLGSISNNGNKSEEIDEEYNGLELAFMPDKHYVVALFGVSKEFLEKFYLSFSGLKMYMFTFIYIGELDPKNIPLNNMHTLHNSNVRIITTSENFIEEGTDEIIVTLSPFYNEENQTNYPGFKIKFNNAVVVVAGGGGAGGAGGDGGGDSVSSGAATATASKAPTDCDFEVTINYEDVTKSEFKIIKNNYAKEPSKKEVLFPEYKNIKFGYIHKHKYQLVKSFTGCRLPTLTVLPVELNLSKQVNTIFSIINYDNIVACLPKYNTLPAYHKNVIAAILGDECTYYEQPNILFFTKKNRYTDIKYNDNKITMAGQTLSLDDAGKVVYDESRVCKHMFFDSKEINEMSYSVILSNDEILNPQTFDYYFNTLDWSYGTTKNFVLALDNDDNPYGEYKIVLQLNKLSTFQFKNLKKCFDKDDVYANFDIKTDKSLKEFSIEIGTSDNCAIVWNTTKKQFTFKKFINAINDNPHPPFALLNDTFSIPKGTYVNIQKARFPNKLLQKHSIPIFIFDGKYNIIELYIKQMLAKLDKFCVICPGTDPLLLSTVPANAIENLQLNKFNFVSNKSEIAIVNNAVLLANHKVIHIDDNTFNKSLTAEHLSIQSKHFAEQEQYTYSVNLFDAYDIRTIDDTMMIGIGKCFLLNTKKSNDNLSELQQPNTFNFTYLTRIKEKHIDHIIKIFRKNLLNLLVNIPEYDKMLFNKDVVTATRGNPTKLIKNMDLSMIVDKVTKLLDKVPQKTIIFHTYNKMLYLGVPLELNCDILFMDNIFASESEGFNIKLTHRPQSIEKMINQPPILTNKIVVLYISLDDIETLDLILQELKTIECCQFTLLVVCKELFEKVNYIDYLYCSVTNKYGTFINCRKHMNVMIFEKLNLPKVIIHGNNLTLGEIKLTISSIILKHNADLDERNMFTILPNELHGKGAVIESDINNIKVWSIAPRMDAFQVKEKYIKNRCDTLICLTSNSYYNLKNTIASIMRRPNTFLAVKPQFPNDDSVKEFEKFLSPDSYKHIFSPSKKVYIIFNKIPKKIEMNDALLTIDSYEYAINKNQEKYIVPTNTTIKHCIAYENSLFCDVNGYAYSHIKPAKEELAVNKNIELRYPAKSRLYMAYIDMTNFEQEKLFKEIDNINYVNESIPFLLYSYKKIENLGTLRNEYVNWYHNLDKHPYIKDVYDISIGNPSQQDFFLKTGSTSQNILELVRTKPMFQTALVTKAPFKNRQYDIPYNMNFLVYEFEKIIFPENIKQVGPNGLHIFIFDHLNNVKRQTLLYKIKLINKYITNWLCVVPNQFNLQELQFSLVQFDSCAIVCPKSLQLEQKSNGLISPRNFDIGIHFDKSERDGKHATNIYLNIGKIVEQETKIEIVDNSDGDSFDEENTNFMPNLQKYITCYTRTVKGINIDIPLQDSAITLISVDTMTEKLLKAIQKYVAQNNVGLLVHSIDKGLNEYRNCDKVVPTKISDTITNFKMGKCQINMLHKTGEYTFDKSDLNRAPFIAISEGIFYLMPLQNGVESIEFKYLKNTTIRGIASSYTDIMISWSASASTPQYHPIEVFEISVLYIDESKFLYVVNMIESIKLYNITKYPFYICLVCNEFDNLRFKDILCSYLRDKFKDKLTFTVVNYVIFITNDRLGDITYKSIIQDNEIRFPNRLTGVVSDNDNIIEEDVENRFYITKKTVRGCIIEENELHGIKQITIQLLDLLINEQRILDLCMRNFIVYISNLENAPDIGKYCSRYTDVIERDSGNKIINYANVTPLRFHDITVLKNSNSDHNFDMFKCVLVKNNFIMNTTPNQQRGFTIGRNYIDIATIRPDLPGIEYIKLGSIHALKMKESVIVRMLSGHIYDFILMCFLLCSHNAIIVFRGNFDIEQVMKVPLLSQLKYKIVYKINVGDPMYICYNDDTFYNQNLMINPDINDLRQATAVKFKTGTNTSYSVTYNSA